MTDTYRTLNHLSLGEYKEKGSKFIAYAKAVYSIDEVKAFLEEVRNEHPKARHHCYAYRLGLDKRKNYRANDDGEPSGSAGKPILGQIDSMELSNIMSIVVRYFGGTKLGVTGLIRAYKTATRDAFEKGNIAHKQVKNYYQLAFNYHEMNSVMKLMKLEKIPILAQTYNNNNCLLNISIRQSESEHLLNSLSKITSLNCTFTHAA